MINTKMIEDMARACFAMVLFGVAINMLSQLHLFGMSEIYKVPQELVYVLLALVGAGGAQKTLSRIVNRGKPVQKAKSKVKLCEHDYLDECPLTVIDKYKAQDKD